MQIRPVPDVENAYVSSEGDNQKLGVTESASLTIKSGKVKNVAPGQSGNPGEKATTISSVLIPLISRPKRQFSKIVNQGNKLSFCNIYPIRQSPIS